MGSLTRVWTQAELAADIYLKALAFVTDPGRTAESRRRGRLSAADRQRGTPLPLNAIMREPPAG
jgi:hypothetical protein